MTLSGYKTFNRKVQMQNAINDASVTNNRGINIDLEQPKLGIEFDIENFHENWWSSYFRQDMYHKFFKEIPKATGRVTIKGRKDPKLNKYYIPSRYYFDEVKPSPLFGLELVKMKLNDNYYLLKEEGKKDLNGPATIYLVEKLKLKLEVVGSDGSTTEYFEKCDDNTSPCIMKTFELTPPYKCKSKEVSSWPGCVNKGWSDNNNPYNEILVLYYIHEVIRLILLHNQNISNEKKIKEQNKIYSKLPNGINPTLFTNEDLYLFVSMITDFHDLIRYKIDDRAYKIYVVMPYFAMTLRDLILNNHITRRNGYNKNKINYNFEENNYEVLKFSNCLIISKLILHVANFLHQIGCLHHDITTENVMFYKPFKYSYPNYEEKETYEEYKNFINNEENNNININYFEKYNRPIYIDFCSVQFLPVVASATENNKRTYENFNEQQCKFSIIIDHKTRPSNKLFFGKPNQLSIENWFLILPDCLKEVINTTNNVLDQSKFDDVIKIKVQCDAIRQYLCERGGANLNWKWNVSKMEVGNIANILGFLLYGHYPFHPFMYDNTGKIIRENDCSDKERLQYYCVKNIIDSSISFRQSIKKLENNHYFYNKHFIDYLQDKSQYLKAKIPEFWLLNEASKNSRENSKNNDDIKSEIAELLHKMIQPRVNDRICVEEAIEILNNSAILYNEYLLCHKQTTSNTDSHVDYVDNNKEIHELLSENEEMSISMSNDDHLDYVDSDQVGDESSIVDDLLNYVDDEMMRYLEIDDNDDCDEEY